MFVTQLKILALFAAVYANISGMELKNIKLRPISQVADLKPGQPFQAVTIWNVQENNIFEIPNIERGVSQGKYPIENYKCKLDENRSPLIPAIYRQNKDYMTIKDTSLKELLNASAKGQYPYLDVDGKRYAIFYVKTLSSGTIILDAVRLGDVGCSLEVRDFNGNVKNRIEFNLEPIEGQTLLDKNNEIYFRPDIYVSLLNTAHFKLREGVAFSFLNPDNQGTQYFLQTEDGKDYMPSLRELGANRVLKLVANEMRIKITPFLLGNRLPIITAPMYIDTNNRINIESNRSNLFVYSAFTNNPIFIFNGRRYEVNLIGEERQINDYTYSRIAFLVPEDFSQDDEQRIYYLNATLPKLPESNTKTER